MHVTLFFISLLLLVFGTSSHGISRISVKSKKTVIITGGNRGIGLAAIKQLASTNEWNILMACRNKQLGELALKSLPIESQCNVKVETLDLANLDSVRSFCASFKASKQPLNVLACNAGVQHSGSKEVVRTSDGFEDTVGTNHIGHFLLMDLLLPCISPKDGRIVFVGSGVHNPDEPGGNVGSKATLGSMSGLAAGFSAPISMVDDSSYDADKAYKDSKLCNVMTSIEVARRLKARRSKITCNVMNPGLIPTTGLFRDLNPLFVFFFTLLTRYVFKVAASEQEGGKRLSFMIASPLLNSVSGAYYSGRPGKDEYLPIAASDEATDETKGKRLFDITKKIVGARNL